jgi:hypothetical protein
LPRHGTTIDHGAAFEISVDGECLHDANLLVGRHCGGDPDGGQAESRLSTISVVADLGCLVGRHIDVGWAGAPKHGGGKLVRWGIAVIHPPRGVIEGACDFEGG